MRHNPDTVGGTDTRLDSGTWSETTNLLVPGLTILWHPDPDRVGERVALPGLENGRSQELARLTPDFSAPGRPLRRPLGDARLSRKPIRLTPTPDGLRLDPGDSRTPVEVDGSPLAEPRLIDTVALDRGVVLLLGQRIVLLLHRLDPVTTSDVSRFGLIGESPGMVRLRRDIQRVTDLDVTVLIRGETGTGKELVANAIHSASPRREAPFVAVNMAAVPPTLAAAELFGAEKGAFTGADQRRAGYFRQAEGGSLFLDEIGETPSDVQAMLLRALETGQVQAVGASQPTTLDVRVISATDRDLETAIADERFRAPLLYRLSGFVLRLPPLRDRREDFGRLLLHFLTAELEAIGETYRLAPVEKPWMPAGLVARLARFTWPGNVRQLQNTVRQLVIANRGLDRFTALDPIAAMLDETVASEPTPAMIGPTTATPTTSQAPPRARKPADIREAELIEVLARHHYRIQAAADALGIPRGSLYELIEKSPTLRKASQLEADEIRDAIAEHGGSVQAAAEALQVSEQALRRRMGQLGLGGSG